ncbi:MAG: hypothetical protein RIG62_13350 [Cyclobacteriaceae bacterium]
MAQSQACRVIALNHYDQLSKLMRILLIALILSSTEVFSQQTTDWINSLENPKYSSWELKPENLINRYLKYDLSKILTPNSNFLGYIGKDYRRLHIDFISIKKSENISNVYYIAGKSTVYDNTCDFEGTVTIEQFREFKYMDYGVDSMYADSGFKAQGIAIGRYRLNENPEQNHVGIFEGIMTVWWYLDKNGKIQYDNLSYDDNYKNNQYIGTWVEYGKTNERPCNWGISRIPFSGDLDWGAGEFSINPKYYEKGWEEYKKR